MNIHKLFILLLLTLFPFLSLKAQYSLGVSGLLNTPSADMHPDGTFTGGANYLPDVMLPAHFTHNTGNYFVDLTFLSFVEIAYRCTLVKGLDERNKDGLQQDRSVSLKLRVLKERKYIPAVVFGSNDAFTTYAMNPFAEVKENLYFAYLYGAITKNISLGEGHQLGFTGGYYIPVQNHSPKEGGFGGIRYVPGFLPQMELIAEYDSQKMNAGVSALFFNHIRIHVFTYGFENVSAGIRYEFALIHSNK